ncbi:hypothetical protein, partial [uncultured Demequina sp.]|uniref:hypothetical protein n=1 Tax=uncultured Demequina sp. TaxID=693499 RepID=UPI0025FD1B26
MRDGGAYYRFTKDEKFKAITMEASRDLMHGWSDVAGFSLSRLTGYEGPTCFKMPAGEGQAQKWCLM